MKRLVAISSVVMALLVPASAGAALGPAESLSSSDESLAADSQVHMADNGLATVFWAGIAGDPAESGIVTRTRTATGGWQPAEVVSDGTSVFEFDVAVAPSGAAIVAWASTGNEILAAYRSSAGTWSDPEPVSPAEAVEASLGVRVAINKFGQAVVAWGFDPPGAGSRAAFARYRSTAGVWSSTRNLGGVTPAGDGLDVIADGLGGFMAFWNRLGGDFRVAVAERPAGDDADWTDAENPVTTSTFATGAPAAAADANGNIVLVWRQFIDESFSLDCPPTCGHDEIWAVTKSPGGAWSAPATISGTDIDVDTSVVPQVRFDEAGNATVVWVRNEGEEALRTNVRSAAGVWSGPATVHQDAADISVPQLAVDQTGFANLVWRMADISDTYTIELSSRPFGGPWTAPVAQAVSISPSQASNHPSVTAAGDGGAAVSWVSQAVSGIPPTEAFARYSAPVAPQTPPLPVTTPAIGTIRILPKKIYRKARVRGSKKKRKTAAKIQFSLSEPADVTLTLALRIKGKVVGGKCVRATKRNSRRRSCELVVPWGKPIVAGRQTGAVSLPFTSKGLRNGNYYLTVNAVSPTGQTAVPKRAKLTIG